MTARDLFLPVAAQPSLEALVDLAVRAEELGYDRVWLPETWGREAATTLAIVAERTDRIGLGTSVLNVFSRSSALHGQLAATQQEASGGRFRLGVGPSGPALIEGWHGRPFDDPLRHTRETVEVVRAVLSGDSVTYQGEYHRLAGFRLRHGAPEPRPPIDAAGLGPKAAELAGRFADGWHALSFTRDGIRDRLEDFERGVDLGERERDEQRVTLGVTSCALPDGDRARTLVAGHIAFYVGAMGTYYRENLARQGYPELANAVAQDWQNGDRDRATRRIREEVLGETGAAGTPDGAARMLERFGEISGIDAIAVGPPRGADRHEVIQTVEALAPE